MTMIAAIRAPDDALASAGAVGRDKEKFATLDALRGVAALAVVLFHFRWMFGRRFAGAYLFGSGYLAVDLFFVLSGFVIAFAYDGRFASGMTLASFARIRLIRLLPMVWVGVGIGFVYLAVTGGMPATSLLLATALNAMALPGPPNHANEAFATNGVVWSLFFELLANFAFVAAYPWLSGRRILIPIFVAGIAMIVFAFLYDRLQDGFTWARLHVGMARVCFSFFLGVWLMRCRPVWRERLPKVPPWLIFVGLTALLFRAPPHMFRAMYDLVFIFFCAPLILMLAAGVEPGLRGWRMAERLALLSYPVYAFHSPVRDIVQYLAKSRHLNPSLVATVAIVAIVPASLLLARWYDEPVRRMLTRRMVAKRRAR